MKKEILVETPKHKLKINLLADFIEKDKIKVEKELFYKMCEEGCANFNKKFSCPPFSPHFSNYVKENELLILMLTINLDQLSETDYREYLKLQLGNAVIKPKTDNLMRELESITQTKFLSTGSCRLCKPCQKKLDKLCKHPDKMRFSLESLGVNCDDLSKQLFNVPMLWYENKKAPKYTSVICALPIKNESQKEELINFLENKFIINN